MDNVHSMIRDVGAVCLLRNYRQTPGGDTINVVTSGQHFCQRNANISYFGPNRRVQRSKSWRSDLLVQSCA